MKLLVALLIPVAMVGAVGASGALTAAATQAEPSPTTSSDASLTDVRSALTRRLAKELDDKKLASTVVAGLDPGLVARLGEITGGDLAGSPKLSYKPSTVPADQVDSLFVFSFAYRIASGSQVDGVDVGEPPPPDSELTPGPTNKALARFAAQFVKKHPVPIIAQWQVGEELNKLGVKNVILVENDVAADGSVIYLSTDGVAKKGLDLAAAQGIDVGHAGVLCHADHVARCVMTARANGITADAPKGVKLPTRYDPKSGQIWTRQRSAYIPADLLGRTILG